MTVIPLTVKFVKEHSEAELPKQGSAGAAGLDLVSCEWAMIPPGERKLVSTGLKMMLPEGYEAQIRPRSGLAYHHGVTVLNAPGTIDEDYRGLVGVVLINHSKFEFEVLPGDRIAQMVIAPCITRHVSVSAVRTFDNTQRGEGGFGSTGR